MSCGGVGEGGPPSPQVSFLHPCAWVHGWVVGWSVGWLVGRFVGRFVVGRPVDLATPNVDQPASGGGKSTGGLSYSATLNLVCQLVGRSVGWSVAGLVARGVGRWLGGQVVGVGVCVACGWGGWLVGKWVGGQDT